MKYILIIVLSIFIFVACKKTVTLDLKNAPPQIVIQGEVTDCKGPYTITINRSADFYADNVFPPVSGAAVKINDNQGVTDSLTETLPGVYSTHILQGIPGNTYTLSVQINDTAYTATSTMPAPVPFDSISFQYSVGFGSSANQPIAVVNFQDPAGINNYYQFELYKNGQEYTQDIFVFSDRLSDGRYISNPLITDSSKYISSGDTIMVKMYCIDKNVYNYFYQLEQSSSGFSASPANPVSNISNGAFGYFSAHTVETRGVIF